MHRACRFMKMCYNKILKINVFESKVHILLNGHVLFLLRVVIFMNWSWPIALANWPIDQLTNLLSKIKLFPEPIETYWFYPKILWNQCMYYSGLFFYRAAVLEKTLEMTLWAYRGAAVAQRYSQESPGMYLSAVLGRKCRRILRFVQTITIQPNALLRILTKNILLCYYCFMLLS